MIEGDDVGFGGAAAPAKEEDDDDEEEEEDEISILLPREFLRNEAVVTPKRATPKREPTAPQRDFGCWCLLSLIEPM